MKNKNKKPFWITLIEDQLEAIIGLAVLGLLVGSATFAASTTTTTLQQVVTSADDGEEITQPNPGGGSAPTEEEPEEPEDEPKPPVEEVDRPLLTVEKITPEQAIREKPFTIDIYGDNIQGLKIVIGNRKFKTSYREEDGREVLSANIADRVFELGEFNVSLLDEDRNQISDVGQIEIVPGTYRARWVAQSEDPILSLNQEKTLFLKVKNTGNLPWHRSGDHPVRLGTEHPRDRLSDFRDESWILDDRPATLDQEVIRPGDMATFTFTVDANELSGVNQREYFGLVAEFDRWFGFTAFWDITVERQPSVFERITRVFSPQPEPSDEPISGPRGEAGATDGESGETSLFWEAPGAGGFLDHLMNFLSAIFFGI